MLNNSQVPQAQMSQVQGTQFSQQLLQTPTVPVSGSKMLLPGFAKKNKKTLKRTKQEKTKPRKQDGARVKKSSYSSYKLYIHRILSQKRKANKITRIKSSAMSVVDDLLRAYIDKLVTLASDISVHNKVATISPRAAFAAISLGNQGELATSCARAAGEAIQKYTTSHMRVNKM
eukprot:TRINITY_DN20176_c0_g1_i1.p1 TRINITY_DN20176_c0_g1~~TRINITY_DN20176_c0_g1_i1.p1  ORF type:complete len:196 (+),score=45.99 TRINITY_DN20176_c0_g1_i1:67-588(+)